MIGQLPPRLHAEQVILRILRRLVQNCRPGYSAAGSPRTTPEVNAALDVADDPASATFAHDTPTTRPYLYSDRKNAVR